MSNEVHVDTYKYKKTSRQYSIYDYIAIPVILLEILKFEAWVNWLGSDGSWASDILAMREKYSSIFNHTFEGGIIIKHHKKMLSKIYYNKPSGSTRGSSTTTRRLLRSRWFTGRSFGRGSTPIIKISTFNNICKWIFKTRK